MFACCSRWAAGVCRGGASGGAAAQRPGAAEAVPRPRRAQAQQGVICTCLHSDRLGFALSRVHGRSGCAMSAAFATCVFSPHPVVLVGSCPPHAWQQWHVSTRRTVQMLSLTRLCVRAQLPFNFFSVDARPRAKAAHPELTHTDITKKGAAFWPLCLLPQAVHCKSIQSMRCPKPALTADSMGCCKAACLHSSVAQIASSLTATSAWLAVGELWQKASDEEKAPYSALSGRCWNFDM